MKQIREIRRENLQRLLTNYRSQRQFAEEVELAAAHVSQMVNGTRDMGEEVARRIERALGLALIWMDFDHTEKSAAYPTSESVIEPLSADQLKLLADYQRLSPKRQQILRETAAAFVKLEQSQQQQ